jgi:hypothetical protein
MNKNVKSFVLGVIITLILSLGVTTFAEGLLKNIQVYVDEVNVQINGTPVKQSFIYEDEIYVPLKDVTDNLGLNIESKDNTVNVVSGEPVATVEPIKDLEVIECTVFRQDIMLKKEKFFKYNGEYYIHARRLNYISGFVPTYNSFGMLKNVFVSRTKPRWFDYYWNDKTQSYDNQVKVGGTIFTEGVVLPIKLDKEDYPELESMFLEQYSNHWFVPISYVIKMMGGTFTVELDKEYEIQEYYQYKTVKGNVATIDFGYAPTTNLDDKGRN